MKNFFWLLQTKKKKSSEFNPFPLFLRKYLFSPNLGNILTRHVKIKHVTWNSYNNRCVLIIPLFVENTNSVMSIFVFFIVF